MKLSLVAQGISGDTILRLTKRIRQTDCKPIPRKRRGRLQVRGIAQCYDLEAANDMPRLRGNAWIAKDKPSQTVKDMKRNETKQNDMT